MEVPEAGLLTDAQAGNALLKTAPADVIPACKRCGAS
jgi:hypothetical protein